MLTEPFIGTLVERILEDTTFTGVRADHIRSIGLTGSHARGTATPFSDVDLHIYITHSAAASITYQLQRDGDYLLSLSFMTIESRYDELTTPQAAIYVVPGLRQTHIAYDTPGADGQPALETLVQAARSFHWEPLQPAANAYASQQLWGFAEEVHKVLGGFLRHDESTILYGTYGLVLGLSNVLAVQRGLLIDSENTAFPQIMTALGWDSPWSQHFRAAAGYQPLTIQQRGRAGLRLYRETVSQLQAIIEPRHQAVIHGALNIIDPFTAADHDPLSFDLASPIDEGRLTNHD